MPQAKHPLQHKVALVTGAARGRGAVIAAALAQAGARLIVTDIDTPRGLQTATRLNASWHRLDVREELAWVAAMARVLDSHGRLDVLVNSAGATGLETAGHAHDPEHSSLQDWQAVHRCNLDGVFLGSKHGLGAMRRSGAGGTPHRGSILHVLPQAGVAGAMAAAWAASRAAVQQHSQTVALYCAATGLAVRCHSLPASVAAGDADAVAAWVVRQAGDDICDPSLPKERPR